MMHLLWYSYYARPFPSPRTCRFRIAPRSTRSMPLLGREQGVEQGLGLGLRRGPEQGLGLRLELGL